MADGTSIGRFARSLAVLKQDADLVVWGRVQEVLREAHTPYNSNGPKQHTLFAFHVNEIIKPDSFYTGGALKVRQNQGNLPWQKGNMEGTGYVISDEPMLRVDRSYLLFLWRPGRAFPPGGTVNARISGVSGPAGDPDEYILACSPRGLFWIDNGRIALPTDHDRQGYQPWEFSEGRQLVGLTVEQAIQLIKSE